jgi:lysophospholipase L1-like esterase
VSRPAAGKRPPLATFHAALAGLASGRTKEPVRVAWLGDSHTAADYYPDAFRQPLQARFGDGGPGHLYLGFRVYRHGSVEYERIGTWTVEPKAPSARARTEDGVFGLGGVRAVPKDAASQIKLAVRGRASTAPLRWEVAYRLPEDRSRLAVRYGDQRAVLGGKATADAAPERLLFETSGEATVTLEGAVGDPRIFGVIVERSEPGVVVDTLGINGARIDTPLAWDEAAWVSELRRRAPALVVLAYGSNEVGDRLAPWRYARYYDELLGRVRQAVPDAACAVLGLPDQAAPDWTTPERVLEIETVQRQVASEKGCAFVSALEAMGGPSSFKDWAHRDPPLAQPDRIHLTPKGYRELGALVARELLPP